MSPLVEAGMPHSHHRIGPRRHRIADGAPSGADDGEASGSTWSLGLLARYASLLALNAHLAPKHRVSPARYYGIHLNSGCDQALQCRCRAWRIKIVGGRRPIACVRDTGQQETGVPSMRAFEGKILLWIVLAVIIGLIVQAPSTHARPRALGTAHLRCGLGDSGWTTA